MSVTQFTDKRSADNVTAWFHAPHPKVGPCMGSLDNAPSGIDTATKAGCKSQSYASWALFSRSYLAGVYCSVTGDSAETMAQQDQAMREATMSDMYHHEKRESTLKVPVEIWAVMTLEQREQMQHGKLVVNHGILMTPEEAMMLRSMSIYEYSSWMIEQYQAQAAAYGVKTLGPDKHDLQKIYDKLQEIIKSQFNTTHTRHRRAAAKSGGKSATTTKTPTTTPVAVQKDLVDKSSEKASQSGDSHLDFTEIESLLDDAEDLNMTDTELKFFMSDVPNAEQMMADDAKNKRTSTGGIPFNTLSPSLIQYSLLMQKERAKLIEETYSKAIKVRRPVPNIPIPKPQKYDPEVTARRLYNRRRAEVQNMGLKDTQWTKPVSKQVISDLANGIVKLERDRRESDSGRMTEEEKAEKRAKTVATALTDDVKYNISSSGKVGTDEDDMVIPSLPIRHMANSTYPGSYEIDVPIPYTPLYKAYEARLVDPTSVGALGAIVRSPNVRDATSLMSLVKAIRLNPGSMMDIAPIVRNALLSISLDRSCCHHDPTVGQMYHNAVRKSSNVHIVPTDKSPDYMPAGQMIAMPLDIFVSFMSNNQWQVAPPPLFHPSNVDSSWCAIPIRDSLTTDSISGPYIISFLDSKYTMGCVNWRYDMQYTDTTTGMPIDNDGVVPNRVTTIPATNLVYIPGPTSAILVLTDVTSSNMGDRNTVTVDDMQIPVYRGNNNVAPVVIRDFWRPRFTDMVINNNRRDIIMAHNHLVQRLAVHNTGSIALSLAAEAYGAARPGICVRPSDAGGFEDYEYNKPSGGAWVIGKPNWPVPIPTTCPLYRGSQIRAHMLTGLTYPSVDPKTWAHVMGFNAAALSSHLLMPCGRVATAYPNPGHNNVHNQFVEVVLDTTDMEYIPSYSITSSSSLSRVATYCGLVSVSQDSIRFENSGAMPAWLHMLSCAQYANTANFLVTNNMTTVDWSGWRELNEDIHLNEIMSVAKQALFSGYVQHQPVFRTATYSGWDTPTVAQIATTYDIPNPFNDMDWMSATPVPTHFLLQWVQKLKLDTYPTIPAPKYYAFGALSRRAVPLERETGLTKVQIYSTIDFERYKPRMTYVDTTVHNMSMWVEMSSFLSMHYGSAPASTQRGFLETMSSTMTPARINLPFVDDAKLMVVGSSAELVGSANDVIKVSNIVYPDPPSFETVLTAAKNYVFGPATAGLMGALAAGVPGAVVGAGSDLASAAIKDILAGMERQRIEDRNREAAEKAIAASLAAQNPTEKQPGEDPHPEPSSVEGPTTD